MDLGIITVFMEKGKVYVVLLAREAYSPLERAFNPLVDNYLALIGECFA